MRSKSSFTALAGAVVRVSSMADLKRYLLRRRPTQRGLPVDRYTVYGDEVRARLVYPDGSRQWAFAGYLEDLARNAQLGYYEPPVAGGE